MRSISFFLVAALAVSTALAQQSARPPIDPDQRFDLENLDKSVDPCVDFFRYSCGGWLARNPIPADQAAWGRGSELRQRNLAIEREVLEKASVPDPKRSAVDQKIGDYYGACMDEKAANAAGTAPLKPELARIAAIKSKNELAVELAHLHGVTYALVNSIYGTTGPAVFAFTSSQDLTDASLVVAAADQGGLVMPDRDYYLKDDAKSLEIQKQYVAHVEKMFELLGEPAPQAEADAKTVMGIETALAKVSMDKVSRRDPAKLNNPMPLDQLAALSPSFDWRAYTKAIAMPASHHILVMQPNFFRGMDALIKSVPLQDWKTYLKWHLLHAAAPALSDAIVTEDFNFNQKVLFGRQQELPRWKRCVAYVDRDLGEALGRAYVDRTFGVEGKQRTTKLVNALEKALGQDIEQLEWMSPATKKEALTKLHAIEDKIGYPARWRDYSTLEIVRGDAAGNALRAAQFEWARELAKIGKPVDRVEWIMTPMTVDAYYDPQLNTINFPAGILQPPFFDKRMDDAVNYGAIGSVIGHELTHGFDDQGRQFDAQGNLRDWWTPEDANAFTQRADCLVEQYDSYVPVDDVHLNGKLTLGENTADNGGLRIALMALLNTMAEEKHTPDGRIDGFTPEQRVFLGFGQGWCAQLRPEMLRTMALTNEHSTPVFRVNGVVSNMPEFRKAFGCKAGRPMVRANACRVW